MGGNDKSFITAYCRNCQAPRYKSIRPLGRKDETRPEYFKALDPEAPAPSEGPASCYLCLNSLVLVPDTKLPPAPTLAAEPVRHTPQVDLAAKPELFQGNDLPDVPVAPSFRQDGPNVYKPAPHTWVETLFELGPDEELKAFTDYPESYLLVTNKRIVRVHKG